ncbi:hypothetical protein SAMN04488063_1093 [Halopelagius inordinatus]|uniref:Uncharacterized protein n=1 Tax=Halopelagius inordinatus TaxID=553467 RepID=A0A1I2N8V5_9EURY|nr:DUF4097 family beta strand repeat-containing protein [Halopelagius inordinatus]SFG00162.1 hypothetical protein SAMN04488063_1093 [Halopelagius inordinatus]
MRHAPSTAFTRRRLLATAGTGAVLSLAGCSAPDLETRRTESFDVSPDGSDSLAVRNRNGEVAVTSGDGDVVSVEVTKRGFGVDESALDRVTVEQSVTDGVLRLDAVYPPDVSRITTELAVEMPRSTSLASVETNNGRIEVRDVGGDAVLRSGNGEIDARGVDGYLTLQAGNGSVEARDVAGIDGATVGNGSVDVDVPAIRGDTEIRASNGGVEARIGPDVGAQFEARASNGGVDVSGIDVMDPTVSRTRVTGTVGGGGPSLTLLAENGLVEVRALEP